MNKTPSILVDTGFEVDQNGGLTEIIFPRVVSAINAPRKVTCEGDTINYIPSTAAALLEFSAPNITTISGVAYNSVFRGFTSLTSVTFNSLEYISGNPSSSGYSGLFYACNALVNINMPRLKSIVCLDANSGGNGVFYGCTGLTSIYFPALESVQAGNQNTPFNGLTGITEINLPKFKTATSTNSNWGAFSSMTGLQTVTLGSEGNPVTSLVSQTFKNCTQSGLTITVYTQGGASLSGAPWGATNATIVYEEA